LGRWCYYKFGHYTIITFVNAIELPLSLLIVGVGGIDFIKMEIYFLIWEININMFEIELHMVSILPIEILYGTHFLTLFAIT
jgi:hypothetical protein